MLQIRKLLARATEIYQKKGLSYLVRKTFGRILSFFILSFFMYRYYKAFKSGSFTFRGRTYKYFYHMYNSTWRNERGIEVPIVWDIVKKHKGKRILEVGNVLSHYFPVQHTILDKYEKAPGVINLDIVDFWSPQKYDLIVSISTLEHVGWDEKPREPRKILRALENLKRCSALGGQIVVTLPLGYNREMDKLLEEGILRFTEQYCLKRISRDNRWIEVKYDEIRHAKYNAPFPNANALIIGIIKRQDIIWRGGLY